MSTLHTRAAALAREIRSTPLGGSGLIANANDLALLLIRAADLLDEAMPALTRERMEVGDYVLATKWGDGDPGDNWALGFYAGPTLHGRHLVVDSDGKQLRHNGFRRVGRVRSDVGTWLLSIASELEKSPPGTVNLWTMLTPLALALREAAQSPGETTLLTQPPEVGSPARAASPSATLSPDDAALIAEARGRHRVVATWPDGRKLCWCDQVNCDGLEVRLAARLEALSQRDRNMRESSEVMGGEIIGLRISVTKLVAQRDDARLHLARAEDREKLLISGRFGPKL